MPKFTPQQVDASLKKLKEWSLAGEAIQRTYQFPNFIVAMKFVDTIAQQAEADQHHPDMLIRYNRVTVTLSTHDVGGISDKDFDAAGKYEAVAKRLTPPASPPAATTAQAGGAGAGGATGSTRAKREKTK
ncbi:MAG: 4a-hydroxytetrahydrobiopterin dehydratase [Phycisphaerales bacterium]